MIWHNFYDIWTKQVITSIPMTFLDGHQFTNHVLFPTWGTTVKTLLFPQSDLSGLASTLPASNHLRTVGWHGGGCVQQTLALRGGTVGRIVVLCNILANLASHVPTITVSNKICTWRWTHSPGLPSWE
jgi:hypothetical protein